ncbi:hypothetical protein TNIN_302541 [Trichonephila inaurata madagascariensis]|uniref:Uncharacterized protein n=1 Tax=Trichonephila inaurata madagascariensis TaxID=2747483 RepID=A0A8X6X418_9ARAC|nr:hypothetical protein TNIN_302541 [Trichonephila inaurata madagascariensis]
MYVGYTSQEPLSKNHSIPLTLTGIAAKSDFFPSGISVEIEGVRSYKPAVLLTEFLLYSIGMLEIVLVCPWSRQIAELLFATPYSEPGNVKGVGFPPATIRFIFVFFSSSSSFVDMLAIYFSNVFSLRQHSRTVTVTSGIINSYTKKRLTHLALVPVLLLLLMSLTVICKAAME